MKERYGDCGRLTLHWETKAAYVDVDEKILYVKGACGDGEQMGQIKVCARVYRRGELFAFSLCSYCGS